MGLGGPQAHGVPEVALFGEDERHRVKGVLGKELRAPEDDDDEAERIKHLCDEERGGCGRRACRREQRDCDGVAQGRKAHEDAAGEAGDGERDAGAAKLLAGVVGDLLVDVLRAGALEVLLRVERGWRCCRRSAEDGAHEDEMQKAAERGKWALLLESR